MKDVSSGIRVTQPKRTTQAVTATAMLVQRAGRFPAFGSIRMRHYTYPRHAFQGGRRVLEADAHVVRAAALKEAPKGADVRPDVLDFDVGERRLRVRC